MKINTNKIRTLFLKALYTLYRLFISLKLAVITLGTLAFLVALGTILESRYDQETANKLIYHSKTMIWVLSFLSLNLTFVLIDRWPWKKRHMPFILAHIGILTVLLGSVFTRYWGIDGSLRFKKDEVARAVSVTDMEINIYSSYDGENFTSIYNRSVDMFLNPPSKKKPYVIQTAGETFTIDTHLPFAVIERVIFKPTKKTGSPALRFHLSGSKASLVEWMHLPPWEKTNTKTFGLATISLTTNTTYKPKHKRELVLLVKKEKLFYLLYDKKIKPLSVGDNFFTNWMDLRFRLLEFFPKSKKQLHFKASPVSSDKTLKAIRVSFEKNTVWMAQNSHTWFFPKNKNKIYVLGYVNKTHPLGFNLKLLDFKRTMYPASMTAKSYESVVQLDTGEKQIISMNNPLKYKGYHFYQSSFESTNQDDYVSILSVNYDPGRVLKYTGCSLVVIGVILLFYNRKIKPIA